MMSFGQYPHLPQQPATTRNTVPRGQPIPVDRLQPGASLRPQAPTGFMPVANMATFSPTPTRIDSHALMARQVMAARIRAAQQMHRSFPPPPTMQTMGMVQPNQSIRIPSPTQGLDLLRTVSLQLPGTPVTALSGGSRSGMLKMPKVDVVSVPDATKLPVRQCSGNSTASSTTEKGGSSSRIYINEILEWDVLCGRGGRSNHHPGNKKYRHVVSEMKAMYRTTEAKNVKTDLSRAIVEHVCNYGGRFVKKDAKEGRYYVLTKAEARKKTSQALRETKELKWTL